MTTEDVYTWEWNPITNCWHGWREIAIPTIDVDYEIIEPKKITDAEETKEA